MCAGGNWAIAVTEAYVDTLCVNGGAPITLSAQ